MTARGSITLGEVAPLLEDSFSFGMKPVALALDILLEGCALTVAHSHSYNSFCL